MNLKKFQILCIAFCFGQLMLAAQPFKVGDACPNFLFSNLTYYRTSNASLAEFRGKHLILDFWTTGCVACIESFKKINTLQHKFKTNVQFVLIGQDYLGRRNTSSAKHTFQKYRSRWNLDLAVSYDFELFEIFEVPFVPYLVWINDKGIITALTNSSDLNEQNVHKFLNGENFKAQSVGSKGSVDDGILFDYNKPLLIAGNGGSDTTFLFRSIIAKWTHGTDQYKQPFINSSYRNYAGMKRNRIQANGVNLFELFQLAYGDSISNKPGWYTNRPELTDIFKQSCYGEYWIRPVLELKDTSLFRYNFETGSNLYSYSLIVPDSLATSSYLRGIMQQDLFDYFGYVATIEIRTMDCWYLISDNSALRKLKTKGGDIEMINEPAMARLRNVPLYQLVRQIFEYNSSEPPIIDKTGILEHIDLDMNVVMMDMNEVKNALRLYGLDLVRGRKDMKVIVIRDRKQKNKKSR